jgi:hypothetical protein
VRWLSNSDEGLGLRKSAKWPNIKPIYLAKIIIITSKWPTIKIYKWPFYIKYKLKWPVTKALLRLFEDVKAPLLVSEKKDLQISVEAKSANHLDLLQYS